MKIRTAILFTTITLLALGGCQETPEPVAEPVPAPPAPVEPEPEPAEPEEPAPAPTPKVVAAPARGAVGTPRWAGLKGNGWIMIRGVDEGTYENYYPSVVKKVQTALQAEGLYDGPISGVLDEATSNAVGEYQKTKNLHVSGVPTPRTREALKIPPRVGSP